MGYLTEHAWNRVLNEKRAEAKMDADQKTDTKSFRIRKASKRGAKND